MPVWFGEALGSAIGLVAILLGALYNAWLTRHRDDRIMSDEAKAIASAIGAEMGMYAELLCGLFSQMLMPPDARRSQAMVSAMKAPDLVIWPSLAGKVGLLDATVAKQTVRSWMTLSMHARMLQACVDDILAGEWDAEKVRSRVEVVKIDMPKIAETVEALTGSRPDLEYLIP